MALEAAARGGHLAIVERLLQEKADINPSAASCGSTPLEAAAEVGHLQVVEKLLYEHAYIEAVGFYGRTALQAAAGGGHVQVVERLLQANAHVNAIEPAAEGGHLQVMKRLLEEDVDAADIWAAARAAERRNHPEALKLLDGLCTALGVPTINYNRTYRTSERTHSNSTGSSG